MNKLAVEEKYKQKDPREHILDRPHNYIGSMNFTDPEPMYVLDKNSNKMVIKKIAYVPAFLKIFDEILTNALDHFAREKEVNNIKVDIVPEEGKISVYNNGPGIEVVKHKEKNIYIPQLIFGNVFTSSNYDDTKERDWAGTNGLGSKATSVFSKKFIVETVDADRGLKYYQEFSDNMSKMTIPVIKETKEKPYTKITFYPDFKRFGMKGIDEDTLLVLEKRVYESTINASLRGRRLTIELNNKKIPISNFTEYVNLFPNNNEKYTEKLKNNWELIISKSPEDKFSQVSFVNGIPTTRGGKHVDYVVNYIVKKATEIIKSKHKNIEVKPSYIKDRLMIFLSISITNPKFDSQTKEYLTTSLSDFTYKPDISDKVIKPYIKDIVDEIVALTNMKEQIKMNKEVNSRNVRKLKIPLLEDAYYAGTTKSSLCSLVLCEGNSAMTGVLSGLPSKERDFIGVFPLRGKLLNIQEATLKQLETNAEIKNIMTILGLQRGTQYTDTKMLRYGAVYICTDQDEDGKHIKALILNFFKTWFPDLLELEYVKGIKTPIVRVDVKKKKEPVFFYNLSDFERWKQNNDFNYKAEYKKGLASLTKEETKIFFSDIQKNNFRYLVDNKGFDHIDLAFSKKYIEARKDWLSIYNPNDVLDYNLQEVNLTDFINKELKHFSTYDNIRSIPHLMDGLKPSQRKILYSCFKRNLKEPIRVAQLAGYVSENAEYHHGEASLQGAIISMAQDFVGSNNINFLVPKDQFGSRRIADDAGSPRYIHTYLDKITYQIFKNVDNSVLEYNKGDEGDLIEPVFYVPIIPTILVNGSKGIGTGYSTTVPMYNPKDIINNLKSRLKPQPKAVVSELRPYYRGFQGTIKKASKGKYYVYGAFKQIAVNKILIYEIPVGKWIEKYKEMLDTLLDSDLIKNYKNNSTDETISFEITFKDQKIMEKLINSGAIYEQLDLVSIINTTNMHLFTPDGKIKKYDSPEEIIEDYYPWRLSCYEKRKKYLIEELEQEIKILSNKIRFINMFINEEIKVFKIAKTQIITQLEKFNFDKVNNNYDYLLKIYIDNLTLEEMEKLENKKQNTEKEYKTLKSKTSEDLWYQELTDLEKYL